MPDDVPVEFIIGSGAPILRRWQRHESRCRILCVVVAVACFVTADWLFVDHADASLAVVWLFFVTAPGSLIYLAMLNSVTIPTWAFIGGFVAIGALQAWVLWRLCRGRILVDR